VKFNRRPQRNQHGQRLTRLAPASFLDSPADDTKTVPIVVCESVPQACRDRRILPSRVPEYDRREILDVHLMHDSSIGRNGGNSEFFAPTSGRCSVRDCAQFAIGVE
jgi:hypothetical protein